VSIVLRASNGQPLVALDTQTSVVDIVGTVAVGTPVKSDRVDYALSLASNNGDVSIYLWILDASASPALRHVTGSPVGPLALDAQGTLALPSPVPTSLLYALAVKTNAWQYVHVVGT
jgi:hypothetical protein